MKKGILLGVLFIFVLAIFATGCSEESANIAGEAYKSLKYKKTGEAYKKGNQRLDRFRPDNEKGKNTPLCDEAFQPRTKLVPVKYCECLAKGNSQTRCEFTYLRGMPGKS